MTRQESPPGREIDLTITGYSSEGEGVGRREGTVFFVTGALIGEQVRARVLETRKSFRRAETIGVLTPSASRCVPPCPSFGRCGGCQLQHLSYNEQLRFKETRVRDALERIGGLDGRLVAPVRGMDDPWRYRNKVIFTVTDAGAAAAPGLLKRNSHEVIPVNDCLLADPAAVPIARRALDAVRKAGKSTVGRIMIRSGHATGERLVVLYTASPAPAGGPETGESIAAGDSSIVGVWQAFATGRTSTGYRLLFGRDYLYEALGAIQFRLSPDSFFQVNSRQAETLYREAARAEERRPAGRVVDAFCGLGGFTLFLAAGAGEVIGIERDPRMVRAAGENAARNGIGNVRFIRGDLEKDIGALRERLSSCPTLVVDPPRRGLSPRFIKTCADLHFKHVLYASCDPATLSRDCQRWTQGGFTLIGIVPIDMFPQTAQVECLAELVRK